MSDTFVLLTPVALAIIACAVLIHVYVRDNQTITELREELSHLKRAINHQSFRQTAKELEKTETVTYGLDPEKVMEDTALSRRSKVRSSKN